MKLEFLHQSVRDHLAAEPLCPVWEQKVECFSSLPENWDQTILFVCERTGYAQPLLDCWTEAGTSNVLKRRAIGLWGQVGNAADWKQTLTGTISGDTLLRDAGGYALRDVLLRAGRPQFDEVYGILLQFSESDSEDVLRVAASQMLAFLNQKGARETKGDLFKGLRSRHPDVRAATLQTATENRALDASVLQDILRLCQDEEPVVRDLAWCAVFSAWRRGASPELDTQIQETIALYQQQFREPSDEYVLVCWMGRSPAVAWVTGHLVQIASDSKANEVVRWIALRHLMRYGHRRFLSDDDWKCLDSVQWPEPAQAVWTELQAAHSLFDDTTKSNKGNWRDSDPLVPTSDLVASCPLHSSKALEFESRRMKAETGVATAYRQHSDNPWPMVEGAYKFYDLSSDHQKEYAGFIAWLLKHETDKERRRAVSFLGNVGMTNPWMKSLRLRSLQHPDAHIRHYTATSTLDFCDHQKAVSFLLHNLRNDEDETARWDAGGALIALVGPAVLPDILLAAQNDPSPSVRAFLLERLRLFGKDERVHEAFLRALSHDGSDDVRVRAIRSYERIGDKRALPALESLFNSTASTPAGRIGDVARQVHSSIAARLESGAG